MKVEKMKRCGYFFIKQDSCKAFVGGHIGVLKLISKKIVQMILVIALGSCLFADPPTHASKESKKYNLSICALFKNEALYLKEWIEYHRVVGVDHFYLYNNGSSDRFLNVLKPYIKEGVVTLISWPDHVAHQNEENVFMWSLSTQISAYENAVKVKAGHETKWLVFLDVDEFLVFPNDKNVKTVLDRNRMHPGVKIRSSSFDASANLSAPERKLLIETIELTKPTPCHPHKGVAKTIFKPDECKGFTWPPYQCHFKQDQQPVELKKNELCINRYENRFKGHLFYGKSKDKLHIDNRMLTEEEASQLLEMDYEIEDQERTIYRFVPDLLKKMGYLH